MSGQIKSITINGEPVGPSDDIESAESFELESASGLHYAVDKTGDTWRVSAREPFSHPVGHVERRGDDYFPHTGGRLPRASQSTLRDALASVID